MAQPIRWDNVAFSNINAGTEATGIAQRGFQNVTDSIFKLADRVKTSKTDQALANMSADGVLSRDELGRVGPGVDMKTILDAQRFDQNSREATQTGALNNALTEQQRIEAVRQNSPEYLKRQEEQELAATQTAQENAKTSKLRAETIAAELGITIAEANRLQSERTKQGAAEGGFITGMTGQVTSDFAQGGRYSRENVIAKLLEQRKAGSVDGWTPAKEDFDDFNLAYENALPGLTDKSQQSYMRGYLRDPATAQNAKYLTELPQYQRWDSTNQAVETAQADVASQVQAATKNLLTNVRSKGGAYVVKKEDGTLGLTDQDQTIPSNAKADYKAALFTNKGMVGTKNIKNSTLIDPGKRSEDLTNDKGFDQLFKAAGGHAEIIQDLMADPELVKTRTRWFGMDPEVWADWATIVDLAAQRKKTRDNEATRLADLKSAGDPVGGNPVFQLNLN